MRRARFASPGRFTDRQEAGRALGRALLPLVAEQHPSSLAVLGLARGGVVVAAEVASAIGAGLDACVVRKIGSPFQPELAIGAVAPGGVRILNRTLIAEIGLSPESVSRLATTVEGDRDRLDALLRDGRPAPGLGGKTVILVDDGLATGASMRAALEFARHAAAAVIVAVPTASPDVLASFEMPGVTALALLQPRRFGSVGQWYERFDEVTSAEARAILIAGTLRAPRQV